MPALPNRVIHAKLRAALPQGTRFASGPEDVHPAIVHIPGFGGVRIYLWTLTADRSTEGARPPGEFKIQIILPDMGARGDIETADLPTSLLGYSPDFGAFVAWEARLYRNVAYSANVQVRDPLLTEARDTGWAVASPRRLRRGDGEEVRVAFTPGNLFHYLRVSRAADQRDLRGRRREAFMLSQTPNAAGGLRTLPREDAALDEFVEQQRKRTRATRLARLATFGPKVKEQYDHACALCGLQLEIVEGAHVVPAYEAESRDEVWNGIAFCPNHHALFDARVFVVGPDLRARVDHAVAEFLRESGRARGLDALTRLDGHRLARPKFWMADADLTRRMQAALRRRTALAAIAAAGRR